MEDKNFKKTLLKYSKKIILLGVLVYFGFGIMIYFFQSSYIYFPSKKSFEDCIEFKNSTKVNSGSVRGYFTKQSLEKIVVLYHGNSGRACDNDYMNNFFVEQGYSTFIVEYSGYAEEGTKPSFDGVLKNVDDTIAFLKDQNFKEIVVVGESLGVGPASYHAYRSPISKLILVTPYNSLLELAKINYPYYPVRYMLKNNFTPDKWLLNYKGDVSVILAEDDKVVPNKLGAKLYGGLVSPLKTAVTIKGSGHNTIYDREEFFDFLESKLK